MGRYFKLTPYRVIALHQMISQTKAAMWSYRSEIVHYCKQPKQTMENLFQTRHTGLRSSEYSLRWHDIDFLLEKRHIRARSWHQGTKRRTARDWTEESNVGVDRLQKPIYVMKDATVLWDQTDITGVLIQLEEKKHGDITLRKQVFVANPYQTVWPYQPGTNLFK